jgi:hypothetical protein
LSSKEAIVAPRYFAIVQQRTLERATERLA